MTISIFCIKHLLFLHMKRNVNTWFDQQTQLYNPMVCVYDVTISSRKIHMIEV